MFYHEIEIKGQSLAWKFSYALKSIGDLLNWLWLWSWCLFAAIETLTKTETVLIQTTTALEVCTLIQRTTKQEEERHQYRWIFKV